MAQYHSAHRKENNSKREFEKLIDPWVVNWVQKDYGVDAFVQIGKDVDDQGSSRLESIFFHVQLKSSTRESSVSGEFKIQIEVSKIKSWSSANIKVLLVLYSEQAKTFYLKWIDDAFVSSLSVSNASWSTKTKLSVIFYPSDLFGETSKNDIRSYLLKGNQIKTVLPGTYFNLKDEVKEMIAGFHSMSTDFRFDSTQTIINDLTSALEQSIYRVAVVGPSKVGKSTLVNALLRRDISPIGIWQTTGVAIQIIPGAKDELEVYFKDGSKIRKSFTLENIKQFASQDFNVANEKKVKLVSVSMINESLEKGISFFDIPGLDDPDDSILQDTWGFVKTFNAVIYLIEVSSAATGSFVFRAEYKKHLNDIGASADKIFLVFNKIDFLEQGRLDDLKTRINYDMKRLGLIDKVSKNLYYVSGSESLKKRISGLTTTSDPTDQLNGLEEDLWAFLLSGNKLGIDKLIGTINNLKKGTFVFEDILKARLLDSEKLISLKVLILEIKNKLPELDLLFEVKKKEIKKTLNLQLDTKQAQLLHRLQQWLQVIPMGQDLPKASDIRKFLSDGVNSIVNESNVEHLNLLNLLKNDADIWIEGNLKKVRELINTSTDTRYVNTAPIEMMNVPDVDLSGPFGMGILGGFLAAILAPGAFILGALAGFFGHLIFSAESRRIRKIGKILDASRNQSDIVFIDIKKQYESLVEEYVNIIQGYASKKIVNYFSDIDVQIKEIKINPLSPEEQAKYKRTFSEVAAFRTTIESISDRLFQYR